MNYNHKSLIRWSIVAAAFAIFASVVDIVSGICEIPHFNSAPICMEREKSGASPSSENPGDNGSDNTKEAPETVIDLVQYFYNEYTRHS